MIEHDEHMITPREETIGFTRELEDLYISCLEWILSRAPSPLRTSLFIDDVDKICF